MADQPAQYSCDFCRSRKVGCTRDRAGCQRCRDEGRACLYSRTGVIRRTRTRTRNPQTDEKTPYALPPRRHVSEEPATDLPDLDLTPHERLRKLAGREHRSFKDLVSLFEAAGSVYHDSVSFDKLVEDTHSEYFSFDAPEIDRWLEAFESFVKRENLLFVSVPPDVLHELRHADPNNVSDKAWLVMFYCFALKKASSTGHDTDDLTRKRLKSNLWLTLNCARLLLEPKASTVQALIVLALHVGDDYATPAFCSDLLTKACTMLQALGVHHPVLDGPSRQRRSLVFWRLNTLDKLLALALRRPPAIHRDTLAAVPLPALKLLLPPGEPMFHAHFMNQMNLLSRVNSELWHGFSAMVGDKDNAHATREKLESWYKQAIETLEAAALAEKPFLDEEKAASMDIGICTVRFHYQCLLILSTRLNKHLRPLKLGVKESHEVLDSLDSIACCTDEPYAFPLWLTISSAWTVFGTMFGEILSTGMANTDENMKSLESMEKLPVFLSNVSKRSIFAARLQGLAERFLEHARSMLLEDGDGPAGNEGPILLPTPADSNPIARGQSAEAFDFQFDNLLLWANDGLLDPSMLDWDSWDR